MKNTIKMVNGGKILASFLIAAIIFTVGGLTLTSQTTATETRTINIGDYIIFGTYYGEPILWRCVDIDPVHGPLMLSDRIISLKQFDAAHPGDPVFNRSHRGSNLWATSNMRSWLNSIAPAGEVVWLCGNPPTAGFRNNNAYAHESGFLSDDNFTEYERNAILEVSQRSLLNYIDRDIATRGTVPFIFNSDRNLANVVSNFDDAFAHYVTDRMFLLDVRQLNRVWLNRAILGENYHMARLTQAAADNDDIFGDLGVSFNWSYWLRTPMGGECDVFDSSDVVLYVDPSLVIGNFTGANAGGMGVRPAFFLNLDEARFISGDGSYERPYLFNRTGDQNNNDTITLEINRNLEDDNIVIITFYDEDYMLQTHIFDMPDEATDIRINVWDGFRDRRPLIPAGVAETDTPTINIGDYIIFGTYYGEPILWRCVDIENGNPLMFADRVISIKPFDAVHWGMDGPNYPILGRFTGGSNFWETSNMRSWLNSTADAGDVVWLCGFPPRRISEASPGTYYDYKSGFLSDDNFTASERSAVLQVRQRSLLNYVDLDMATVGTELHIMSGANLNSDDNFANVVQNFDDAFAHYVTDRMFLLDVRQLNRVWQNSNILGENYYFRPPTQRLGGNSETIIPENNWTYWLRTPYSADGIHAFPNAGSVRTVLWPQAGGPWEMVNATSAFQNSGVRPAFFLNLNSMIVVSGEGTYENPFIVDGNGQGNWSDDPGNGNDIITLEISRNLADDNMVIITFYDENYVLQTHTLEIPNDATDIRIKVWDGFRNRRPLIPAVEIN